MGESLLKLCHLRHLRLKTQHSKLKTHNSKLITQNSKLKTHNSKMDSLLIKVCGMTDGDNIRQVEALGVDFIGFVFYPRSPRFVYQMPGYLPRQARRVGVFVNETKENVRVYADRFDLDFIQLHGTESPFYCQSLREGHGLKVIKAFHLGNAHDVAATEEYHGTCDYFLFESKTPQPGGTGRQFDWTLLHRYAGRTPFFLSGGLNAGSAGAIRRFRHPGLAGIDLNSRFETSPGVKDVERLRRFLDELRE